MTTFFKKQNIILIVTWLVIFEYIANAQERATDEAKDKFLAGWRKLEVQYSNLVGDYTIETYRPSSLAKPSGTANINFMIAPGKARIITSANGEELVEVINHEYSFVLSKKKGSTDYVLEDCVANNTPLAAKIIHQSRLQLNSPLMVGANSLLQMSNNRDFVLQSIANKTVNGSEYVELHCQYSPRIEPKFPEPRAFSGILLLDPANDWRVQESSQTITATRKDSTLMTFGNKVKMEYGNLESHLLRKITRDFWDSDSTMREVYTFNNISKEQPSDKSFMLSDFGLHEPTWLTRKNVSDPISWYLWFAIAGIIILITAVILSRKRRKTATL